MSESAGAFLSRLNEVFANASSEFRPLELDASLGEKATLSILLQTLANLDKKVSWAIY